jgi:hypothetical protein
MLTRFIIILPIVLFLFNSSGAFASELVVKTVDTSVSTQSVVSLFLANNYAFQSGEDVNNPNWDVAPYVASATVHDDSPGYSVELKYNDPTNRGNLGFHFACTSLFSFNNADQASCYWYDSKTVRIFPKTPSDLPAGSTLTVAPVVVGSLCPEFVPLCSPVKSTTAQAVSVTAGTLTPVTVVIHAVKKMTNCSNWYVDLSDTTGNYGQNWDTINIDITSSNSGENVVPLKSFIGNVFTTSSPFAVDRSFFMIGSTYQITFGLCSATGPTHACGSATTTLEIVPVGTAVPPTVFIPGGSVKTIKLADSFNLTAVAFVKTCGNSFKTATTLSYDWKVYDITRNTYVGFTPSRNPSELHLGVYGFGTIGDFTVSLVVTDSSSGLNSGTLIVTVHVLSAPLIPIITTYYPGDMANSLTLYGSSSIDPDNSNNPNDQSLLTHTWTCFQLLPTRGLDCSGLTLTPLFQGTVPHGVKIDSTVSVAVDTVYQIAFKISNGARESTTYAAIKVLIPQSSSTTFEKYTAMEALKNVNPSDRFYLKDTVNFYQTCSLDWVTSDSHLSLTDQALNPTSYGFSSAYYNSYFHLYLKAGALQPYSSYTFYLQGCSFPEPIMKLTALTNGPPVEGQFFVSPSTGVEYVTSFLLKTKNWYDNDLPLSYAYGFSLYPEDTGLVSLIQDRTHLRYYVTQLPFNSINQAANGATTVVLMVYDSLGMSTKVSLPVAVSRAFPTSVFANENAFQQQLWNDFIAESSYAADYVKPVAARVAMSSRLSLSYPLSAPYRQNLLTLLGNQEYYNIALTDAKMVSAITDVYMFFTQPNAFTSSELLYAFQQLVVSMSDRFDYYYAAFDLKILSKLMELLDLSMEAQNVNPSLYYPAPSSFVKPMSVIQFADRVIAGYHGLLTLTYLRNELTVSDPCIFQHFARNTKILSLRQGGGSSWFMQVPNPSSMVTINGNKASLNIAIPTNYYDAFSTNNVDLTSYDSTVIRQNCSSGFKAIIYSPPVHLHMWFISNEYKIDTPIQVKLPWSVAAVPADLGLVKCNFFDSFTGLVKSSNDVCTVSHIDGDSITCNCVPTTSNGLYDVQQGIHIRVVASSIVPDQICGSTASTPTFSPVDSPVWSPTLSPVGNNGPSVPTLKINVYHNDDYQNPSLNPQSNVEVHCISIDPFLGNPTYIRGTYGMRGYFEGSFVSAPVYSTLSAAVNYFEVSSDSYNANQEGDVNVETGAGMLYFNSYAYSYQSGTAFSSGVNSQTNRGSFKSWGVTSLCGRSDYGLHSLYACLGLDVQTTTLSFDDIAKQYCLWDRHHLEENNYNELPGGPTAAEQDVQHLNILTDMNWKIFADNNRHGENVNTFQSLNIGFDNEAQLGGVLLGGYRYIYNDHECLQLGCASGGNSQGGFDLSSLFPFTFDELFVDLGNAAARTEYGVYGTDSVLARANNSLIIVGKWHAVTGPFAGQTGSVVYSLFSRRHRDSPKKIHYYLRGFYCHTMKSSDLPATTSYDPVTGTSTTSPRPNSAKVFSKCYFENSYQLHPKTHDNQDLSKKLFGTYNNEQFSKEWDVVNRFMNIVGKSRQISPSNTPHLRA